MKVTPLDKLFSEFIRRRAMVLVNGCERCLTMKYDIIKEDGKAFPAWKQLQCSHFWGRGKKSVRYDEDNAVGLCGACHMYFTANPGEHKDWFLNRLGQKGYDMLEGRARKSQKIDDVLMAMYLKQELKILEVKE